MPYLSPDSFNHIAKSVELVNLSDGYRICDFESEDEDYNVFLKEHAIKYNELGMCKTHLLINKQNGDVIGYFTLNADAILLTKEEKCKHSLDDVLFKSIPSLKIGMLAVDRKYNKIQKGYGSFLIEMCRGFATELNKNGIGCRFIIVDADIRNGKTSYILYEKNGFIYNIHDQYKKRDTSKSMRLEIFNDIKD